MKISPETPRQIQLAHIPVCVEKQYSIYVPSVFFLVWTRRPCPQVGSPAAPSTTGTATDKAAPTSATEQPQEPHRIQARLQSFAKGHASQCFSKSLHDTCNEWRCHYCSLWQETPNASEEKPATTEASCATCECVHAENDSYRVCGPYPQEPSATGAATAETLPAAAPEQPQEPKKE